MDGKRISLVVRELLVERFSDEKFGMYFELGIQLGSCWFSGAACMGRFSVSPDSEVRIIVTRLEFLRVVDVRHVARVHRSSCA